MSFLGGSFPVGRLFGIAIRVHILFLIWIGFSLLTAGEHWQQELKFLAMLFGIVLLHELGHCFGARAVGGYADNILMWPLGGLAYAHAPMRPWPQFVTVAAGPLVNVLFCVLSAAAIFALSGWCLLPGVNPLEPTVHFVRPASEETARWLNGAGFSALYLYYRVNLWLLAFNLLPIYPLDGGQLLHAIIWPFLGLQRATITACYIGLAGAAYFAFKGLNGGGGNMLVFIALFGGFTCWQRLQLARRGLLQEDSRFEAYYGPSYDPRPWWQRLLRIRRRPGRSKGEPATYNPNPGGWAARQTDREREDAELDRILKKVSERGIQSLSYVERQTLERITRERRQEESQFQSDNRL